MKKRFSKMSGLVLGTIVLTTLSGFVNHPGFPSDVIDYFDEWKITLGDGSSENDLINYEHEDYFYNENDGLDWVVYKTPNSGGTTPNSSNTRSELRHLPEWTPETGGKLTGTLKVMQVSTTADARVPAAFSVVIGQIHSSEGHENEPLKIFYKKFPGHTKGSVFWNYEINTEGDNSERWDYSTAVWGYDWAVVGSGPDTYPDEPEDGIELGEEFSYEINVYQGIMYLTFESEGHETFTFTKSLIASEYTSYEDIPEQVLTVFASTGQDGTEKADAYAGELQYFKQGAYNQTNGKDPADNMVWNTGAETYGGDLAEQYAKGSYAEVWFKAATVGEGTGSGAVSGVSLDQESLTLDAGKSAQLVAKVEPEDAADLTVSWSSSDEAVATVADGKVTAVAEGTATITVTTTDGGFTAECTVTVNAAPVMPASPVYTHYFEGATAGEDLESLESWFVTTKDGYNGGVSPIFSDQDVLFYSDYIGSDMGISVEIDSANGGVGGDATRRYSSGWNVVGDDTLKFDASRDYVASDTYYAAFLVKPLGPDYGGMRDIFQFEMSPSLGNWSRGRVFMDISGDSDVQFGVGKKNGPVEDGDTSATFVDGVGSTYLLVLAYEQAAGEDNDVAKLYVNPDPTKPAAEQTDVLVSPDLANDYNSGDGVLPLRINIAQRGHTAEIGCIRVGKDWKEVIQGPTQVTGISLDQTSLSLEVGETATLVATVEPEDASDPTVNWSSSNEAVATIADGVVTAVADGTATITAATTEIVYMAECEVTVGSVTGISGSSVSELHIYPNPSTGAFTIGNSEGADVVIYNAVGGKVFEKSNIGNNELIDAGLNKGMYFVNVSLDREQSMAKLIIE